MSELENINLAEEFPDGGSFVSNAEVEQIIKKRVSVKGTRSEFYEMTNKYVTTVPPIKDYAGLKKKLEKFGLSEQAQVQLINLAPTTAQEVSDYIPGGKELSEETVNEIIKIIKEELASAQHIDNDFGDYGEDIVNEL